MGKAINFKFDAEIELREHYRKNAKLGQNGRDLDDLAYF